MRRFVTVKSFISACIALVLLAGCARDRVAGADRVRATESDLQRARQLNLEGAAALEHGTISDAITKLEAAVKLDASFPAAHNNLGAAYLYADRFYDAAWQFQYASKLMPQSGDPINNLGLVHEATGRLEAAKQAYAQAHRLEPLNPVFAGNFARVRLRLGEGPEDVQDLLRLVRDRDERAAWSIWASQQLLKLNANDQGTPRSQESAGADD